jgi:hypothetical protein
MADLTVSDRRDACTTRAGSLCVCLASDNGPSSETDSVRSPSQPLATRMGRRYGIAGPLLDIYASL